jgi:hypothetical protein
VGRGDEEIHKVRRGMEGFSAMGRRRIEINCPAASRRVVWVKVRRDLKP